MLANQDLIEVARHCNHSTEQVLRVYHGGSSSRIRDRVKTSAAILGFEPPPEQESRAELDELNFDS